jgi:hypothetical protein
MDDALPGADLIEAGLKDLREGRETIAALLVQLDRRGFGNWGLIFPMNFPPTLNIDSTNCWLRMIPIRRIHATMRSFADW